MERVNQKDWFEGEKGETLSFEKICWTENMCAVSVSLTEKHFFPNIRVWASLITLQGQRADIG